MLSSVEVIARYVMAFCFFYLSGSEIITGTAGAISGILGTVELSTALLRYSPLFEIFDLLTRKND